MNQQELLTALGGIFSAVLERPGLELTALTSAADIPEWDSLNNIQLIVAVEKKFGVRFTSAQIIRWKNVGDMCADILKAVPK